MLLGYWVGGCYGMRFPGTLTINMWGLAFVGAGLLANTVDQPMNLLTDTPLSRASSLPQLTSLPSQNGTYGEGIRVFVLRIGVMPLDLELVVLRH